MMMDVPLLIPAMIERAEKYFAKKEVVSRTASKIQTLTYGDIAKRTRRLSSVLHNMGIQTGDKVGTIAWNHHRHLEAYFAIPGIGAVLHTINIRLSENHMSYIINHAEDQILLIDEDMVPIVERIQHEIPHVKAFIIMTDENTLPQTTLSPVYHYEQLLEEGDDTFSFIKDIDEKAPAAMCYTSATTGKPKGVVYTHRSISLHSYTLGLVDGGNLSEVDTCMPVVPMFHVNAAGYPFACTWFGTKLVLPGPRFTPEILAQFIESEKVTVAAAVPTVWISLLQELEKHPYDISSVHSLSSGGSAAPKSMIRTYEEKYGIFVRQVYGMTEASPTIVINSPKSYQKDLPVEKYYELRSRQGYLLPGLEMKVVGENGEIKWDGKEMGEIWLRGPWIAGSYYKDERTEQSMKDGWLHTGDIATVDEEGFIKIVDRNKDLIKSGGEWISSVDLENALMAHEQVLEAAVVAVPHAKWQERPIACVVVKEGQTLVKEVLYTLLGEQFPKWWMPDDILFVDEIPKTSTGKFLKQELRDKLKEPIVN
ncbi:TPA: long-chain fatty acid--CoA ligase [Bacillus cereus]|uniref:AMP-binding enzyme family protein n=1 Tax=Bacillus thuringiensis TaxID=1428 RepID=A0AB33B783_BACTU|nr:MULTISPECIES: long-chain fatty acid--CoA ligase [Bacillus cereus group]HDR7533742.1 long-chain fatty acid--CoA ligase [Bacillus anthracis]AJG79634.1 AMP-binding enzyme family protein [Bacillus thuringiensis]EEM74010.1 Medium-chain-fatty-acid--CoA ligase [Bacillus thuringiensis serovar pondicheriensis BGSC 4BA1]KAA0747311.1 fatty-acid--CoA ligase [Bacillus sp. AY1-10]MCU5430983.1 long-chain fatty acid--CoA ligase [Bacillus cereus]